MKTKDIFHHMQEDERDPPLLEAFWEEGAQSLMGGGGGRGDAVGMPFQLILLKLSPLK